MDVDLLRIADACARSVAIEPSKIKHSNSGLRVFGVRKFQKAEVIGRHYATLVSHDLSSRKHTRKMYGDGVLGVDVTWFSKYVLQVHVQRGRFEESTERLGYKKDVCVVPASFLRARSPTTSTTPKKTSNTISTRRIC